MQISLFFTCPPITGFSIGAELVAIWNHNDRIHFCVGWLWGCRFQTVMGGVQKIVHTAGLRLPPLQRPVCVQDHWLPFRSMDLGGIFPPLINWVEWLTVWKNLCWVLSFFLGIWKFVFWCMLGKGCRCD